MIDFNDAGPQHDPGKPNGRNYWEEIDQAEQAHARGEEPPKSEVPKLHLIDAADLEGIVPPKRKFLVELMLSTATVALLAGTGGVGKSLFALQLAECIRRGIPFLGRETTPTTVLIYSCEDDRDELHRRLARLQRGLGLASNPPGRILLAPRVGEINALITFDPRTGIAAPTDAFLALEAAAIEHGARLIVIDTSGQTFPGSENDRAQVTSFVNMLARLALKTNGCVLVLAHPPKNEAEWSGSTAWDGTVRARLLLSRKDEEGVGKFFLKLAKANYAPQFEDELVRDEQSGLLYLADNVPPSMAEKINAYQDLAKHKQIFLGALDILTKQGRAISHTIRASNYAPKAIITAELHLGCSVRQLARAMEALFKDGVIVASAVVGKKANRVPIYGIARAATTSERESSEVVAPSEDDFMDVNDYPETAE